MTAFDVFAVVGIVSVPVSLGLGAALLAARAELRVRRENDIADQKRRGVAEDALVTSRQLESTMDAVAIEVERLAESHRFVARLLADRMPSLAESLTDGTALPQQIDSLPTRKNSG